MALNFDGSWRPPKASDLGGPEQLADVMIDFRHWHATKGLHANGSISDDSLRRLIKLAYFASQTPEEGRYPKFRLCSPAAGTQPAIDDLRILRFKEPRPLRDVDSVRRLFPLVSTPDRSLLVAETATGLVCEGIMSVVRPTHLGPPQQGVWTRPEGLMVRVDEPGNLQVTEAGLTFVLRAGIVENITPYHLIEPVKAWFTELADALVARCVAADPGEERTYLASHSLLRMLITSLWADVLLSTLNLRHGGAFIIVPEPATAPLIRKTEVEALHLGAEIEAYWKSRMLVEQQQQKAEIARTLQACHKQWHRLLVRAKALAHLSAVDGCVVLDRELRVDAFGALIHVDAAHLPQAAHPDLDYWTQEPFLGCDHIGTRHHSARNLCQAHPGAFAFVISQDGELTLLFSTAQGVFRAGRLSAADGLDW
jgi:hypothetical protein